MNIKHLCNLYSLGLIRAEDLPSIAESLITEGIDNETLTNLLITESPYSSDKKTLFEKAIKELGYIIPTQEEAATELTKEIATKIINGEMDEYEGSMKIWKDILDHINPIPNKLWVFKSSASAIEDYLFHEKESGLNCTEAIAEEKQKILKASIQLCEEA